MYNIFRLGVAGGGRMGRNHIAALTASKSVSVVAIAEPHEPTRARDLAHLPGVTLYNSLEAMLTAGGLDGVLIATPSGTHVAAIAAIAAAGLPILCEKPCGLTAAETRQAQALAQSAGVLLQIAYWRRFVPALQALKRQIDTGALGKLYHITSSQWDEAPPAAAFRAGSGGIFIDMGVHEFDQIRWLTGEEFGPLSVVASDDSAGPPGTDPNAAHALATLSGGTTAMVALGRRFAAGDACWVEVFGTEGHVLCPFLPPETGTEVFQQALHHQAEAFAAACRGTTAQAASAQDAYAAITLAQSATSALATASKT